MEKADLFEPTKVQAVFEQVPEQWGGTAGWRWSSTEKHSVVSRISLQELTHP